MGKRTRRSAAVHATKMVARNYRSYVMLSVTIILSFAVLLGYLTLSDSALYNQYRELLALPGNIVLAEDALNTGSLGALPAMVSRADPDARGFSYVTTTTRLWQYSDTLYASLYFMPEGRQRVFVPHVSQSVFLSAREQTPIAGREYFELYGNEAFIGECLYRVLNPEGGFPFPLFVPVRGDDGNTCVVELSVVGVCPDTGYDEPPHYVCNDSGEAMLRGSCSIYTTQAVLRDYPIADLSGGEVTRLMWFCCKDPDAVAACVKQLGRVNCYNNHTAQTRAREAMRAQSESKLYTVIVLLLVLGLNLYSSFRNALSDRQFEIGVRRAIGAGAWDIIKQFLLEGMLVMLANILLSVVLVADGMLIYKLVLLLLDGTQWTVTVSRYSLAMFAVCSVSLTVLFSTLFAYSSSRVEIIRHLKAE